MRLRPFAELGPWWLPAGISAGGLGLVVVGSVRLGGWVVFASLVVAAVLRVVVRKHPSGLVVRTVGVDVVTLLALAGLLAFAVAIVDL